MKNELMTIKENPNMKHLQLKYNLLQALYWTASCALCGFIAIFLQAKGLTNTQIGTVTGGACILNMVLSPVLSTVTSKFNKISLQGYILAGMMLTGAAYVLIGYVNVPVLVLMVTYMLTYCLNIAIVPLLASISMNYTAQGHNINFGLARGLGSIAYAISAVVFTQVASIFTPTVLSMAYLLGSLAFIAVLLSTPKTYAAGQEEGEKGGSLIHMVVEYKAFFAVLLGFALIFAASTCLSTYLINIIKNLGGTQELYGMAIFAMAATELPVMAVASKLQKRFTAMQLMAAAAIFYIFRNVLIASAPSLPILILGLMMQGCSYGLMTAVVTVYVNENLKKKDQVMGQTMISVMTCGLGSCIGNVFGGIFQDTFGIEMMFGFTNTLTVLGAAIIVATAVLTGRTVVRHFRKSYQM
ncbi:MAG: MFS transporter [Allobaculum sp.]